MHDNPSDDHIDQLIDDVARSMTSGTPPESLREEVLRRIEPSSWQQRAVRVRMWQIAAAAAATVAVAFVVSQNVWSPLDPISGARPADGDQVRVDVPLAVPGATESKPARSSPADAARAGLPRTPLELPAAVLPAPELIVIESLDVEPIGPQLVAVDTIPDPMPIVIDPLRVEPLSTE